MLTGVGQVLEEMESHKDDTSEKPYDNLRVALEKKIHELRLEGLVRPEMFMDKPVDADDLGRKVREWISPAKRGVESPGRPGA